MRNQKNIIPIKEVIISFLYGRQNMVFKGPHCDSENIEQTIIQGS